ncbi:MAG: undecaprenyl/decaprenyl-phosphate alpha-N-acetylglucosaminyl 1-phosphate transferase [Planctomycetes bacterium]|nr:undecaprenyl/decaprenyl-phosphate alpha-N-acetylglucosaminyl 1-phosphate transferase [Planctomycetota bacterium]
MLHLLEKYQLFGWLALAGAAFATPAAARLARRLGVMDMPDTFLKPHARPTPYLGGLAICLGWVASVAAAMVAGRVPVEVVLPILLGGVAMSVLGLLDDSRGLSPKIRLTIGAVIIAAVLITTGTGFQLMDSLFLPIGIKLPPAVAIPLSIAASIFIVLGACNSTNLIDGLDGLCTGVTAIISLSFFLLAAHLASFKEEENHSVRLVLSIAMAGAALGFLPWNFNPARIFMGDAGSVLLGFNCGILILLFAEWGIVRWVLGALMIFALPVFDTALAMFRRFASGKPVFQGDRSHFYDQLVQRGLSVKQTVLVCYALTLFFAITGLLVVQTRTLYALAICVVIGVAVALAAWITGLTHPEKGADNGNG